ncbi:MAG: WYL domain-containing protein [Trueperaceae bacterium]|nr:WYL domain-containing protein [Trueperaceae bacterium]
MTRTTRKAQRLTELVDLLQRRPRGVGELAQRFGVTRRTIERDLEAVREMGHALQEEDHRYALPVPGGGLNEVEALAVHSATRLLVHTGIGERHYQAALEKLARYLPEPARSTLIDSVERLEPAPDDRNLDLVAQAWFQGRVLRCRYDSFSSGRTRTCELEIYYYEVNRRNLDPYVVAYERVNAQEIRTYKLARMRQARLLEDAYRIPVGFDPHAHLSGAWGVVVGEPVRVLLRAAPYVAPWFRERERRDRYLRIIDTYADGGVKVELNANLARGGGTHELSGFLLGWGPAIEVLAPASVRARVQGDLRKAAEAYGE